MDKVSAQNTATLLSGTEQNFAAKTFPKPERHLSRHFPQNVLDMAPSSSFQYPSLSIYTSVDSLKCSSRKYYVLPDKKSVITPYLLTCLLLLLLLTCLLAHSCFHPPAYYLTWFIYGIIT